MNIVTWFRQIWPWDPARGNVLAEYQTLGTLHYALTDIALRGGVFTRPQPVDPHRMAWLEGRRSLALEVIELARVDPVKLSALIARKPEEDARDRSERQT